MYISGQTDGVKLTDWAKERHILTVKVNRKSKLILHSLSLALDLEELQINV